MGSWARRNGRLLNRVGRWSLAAAAIVAPLALGGVPHWVMFICAPLCLLALIAGLVPNVHLKLAPLALVPLAVAAVCALQLLPLPPALLALLSPSAAELREFALVPLGLTAWRPISLEPEATWRELGKHLLYVTAFLAASHISAGSRSARPMLLGSIAACAGFVVLLAAVHPLLGLDELYGVYHFNTPPRLVTSFVNPNHFAGFSLLGGALSLGLAIEATDRRRRSAWLIVFAVCALGSLFSLSRAGIGAFAFCLLLFLLAFALSKRRARNSDESNTARTALRWGAVALGSVAVGVFLLFDRLSERFTDLPTYALKLIIWPSAARASADFWRTGMGRGAFEVGFTRFIPDHLGKTYTHPENFVFQLTSEMGVIAAAAIIGLSAWALLQQVQAGRRSPLELSVAVAAVSLALHNLFDFNLEFPGVALPLSVALGVSAGDAERLRVYRVARAGAVLALGAVMVSALILGRGDLRSQEAVLLTRYRAAPTSADARELALGAIDRHPANYLPYSLAGAAYVEKPPLDALQAIAFANRALFLFPKDFGSHQVAARALRRLGRRSQALLEYRLAYEVAVGAPEILRECAAYGVTADELLQCVPLQVPHVALLLPSVPHRSAVAAGDACIRALTEMPIAEGTAAFAVQCAQLLSSTSRRDEAIAVLDASVRAVGDLPELAIGRAEVLRRDGATTEALSALEAALKRSPTHYDITVAVATQYLGLKRFEAARAVLVRAAAVTTDSEKRAVLIGMEAEVELGVGDLERALAQTRSAAQLRPTAHRHYATATLLMQLGRVDEGWAEVRGGQRLDTSQGAVAAEERFKTIERDSRRPEAVKDAAP